MLFLTPRDALSPLPAFDWLREEMDRLLASAVPGGEASAAPLRLSETDDAYEAHVAVAGADPGSLDVQVEGNVLRISGERAAPKDETCRRLFAERMTGAFVRTLELPVAVDAGDVTAAYRDGVLSVKLPKAAEARPQRIAVQV